MSRARLLDALILLLLFCAGVAVRLPLVPLLDFSSDATDPIVSALRMLESWNPFLGDSARFGYGRSLSYVPLVAGVDDGLSGFALRRIAIQALIAPVVYVSVRMLTPKGGRSHFQWGEELVVVCCALTPAVLLVVHQDLLLNLLWGHHGYLGPEWAALMVLGFCGLLTGSTLWIWPVLMGVSLAMCVMNHPYALSLASLLWVVWVEGRENRDPWRSRSALMAAGLASLALLPHAIYLVLTPGGAADVFESVVSPAALSVTRPVEVAQGLFSHVDAPSALLFSLSVLIALSLPMFSAGLAGGGLTARAISPVGMGAALSFAALLLLGLASRQVHNWHWRMLLPLMAVCVGLVLSWLAAELTSRVGEKRGPRVLAWMVAVFLSVLLSQAVAAGYRSFQSPAEQPRESLLQFGQIERLYAALEEQALELPWTLVAVGSPPEQSYARLLPLGLQRALSSESALAFSSSEEHWLRGPTAFYFEGSATWIDRLAEEELIRAAELLWRGQRSLAVRVDSRERSLAAIRALCAASESRAIRVDSPRDLIALLMMVGLVEEQESQQNLDFPPSCLRLAY